MTLMNITDGETAPNTNIFIYGLVDPTTKEIRYVGQTTAGLSRPRKHLCPSKRGGVDTPLKSWINALVANKLMPEITILEECEKFQLNGLEQVHIAYLKYLGNSLLNRDGGGQGGNKLPPGPQSPELIKKRADGRRGKKNSKPMSEEQKAYFSQLYKGKVNSEETKQKMSEARRAYWAAKKAGNSGKA